MCKYCEGNKPIRDNIGDRVKINNTIILSERKIGNIFNAIKVYTTIKINYCPICGKRLNNVRKKVKK